MKAMKAIEIMSRQIGKTVVCEHYVLSFCRNLSVVAAAASSNVLKHFQYHKIHLQPGASLFSCRGTQLQGICAKINVNVLENYGLMCTVSHGNKTDKNKLSISMNSQHINPIYQ